MKPVENIDQIKSPYSIPGIKETKFENNLNKSYTFDNLIKGDFNKMAINGGEYVSRALEHDKRVYQPLMLFGPTGLGKTHILHAIGNRTIKHFPESRPFYINTNQFKRNYMAYIKANDNYDFVNFYRSVDMLLIDDIEEIFSSEKTQDIFFHIFNMLYQSDKQIVISSSLEPSKFYGMDQKLMSRLKWGASIEIYPPNFEDRLNILKNKASSNGINLHKGIFEYIAKEIKTNIRELEGTLWSILVYSVLDKREIDLAFAQAIIQKIYPETKKTITVQFIEKVVCDYFNLSPEMIHTKTRKREIVQARQISMYFSKNLTKSSLATIGANIGGKDHATVLHACKTVNNLSETDKKFRFQIEDIEKKLQ